MGPRQGHGEFGAHPSPTQNQSRRNRHDRFAYQGLRSQVRRRVGRRDLYPLSVLPRPGRLGHARRDPRGGPELFINVIDHRPLRAVTDDWDWQILGACRGMDVDLVYHPARERRQHTKQRRIEQAKTICQTCRHHRMRHLGRER